MTSSSAEQLRHWLSTMVQLQSGHNEKVHPQWDRQGYPFTRAIWIECAELMDHYGWKWWKHQDADLDQVKLELVDIWHFGLSALIIQHQDSMWALPMSFEDLYTIYVPKNVLNVFRQENGYKEGTYRKSWAGREDNEHLAELAQTLDIDSATYIADLQLLLARRYEEVFAESN